MRNTFMVIGVAIVAILGGTYFFLYGPGGFLNITNTSSSVVATNSTPQAAVVPFTELARGSKSSVTRRVNYLVTTTDGLKQLWKLVSASSTPPKVDFTTHAVIAVFAGKEPTASIAIAKIEDMDARMVSVALTKPVGACAGKATTSSYEIVAVPATSLPFAHQDLSATTTCAN